MTSSTASTGMDLSKALQTLDSALTAKDVSQIQWSKVLPLFLDLPFDRQLAALKHLKPSQLDDIADIAKQAKSQSETAMLNQYLLMMKEDGIELEALTAYAEKNKEAQSLRGRSGNSVPDEVKKYIKKTLDLTPKEQLEYIETTLKYPMKQQNLYAMRNVLKKQAAEKN